MLLYRLYASPRPYSCHFISSHHLSYIYRKWSESSWKKCGGPQGVFLLHSSTFPMLGCLNTCSKAITSFPGLILHHSQISGSFPGPLSDIPVTLKVAGAIFQSNLLRHIFPLFEHFPPSTEWTWSKNFTTPKIMVLNVMPCSLLKR